MCACYFKCLTTENQSCFIKINCLFSLQRNTQERDGGRESPRPTPEAASLAEVPVAGSSSAAAVQELTVEAMKKKSISIINEYLNIKDVKVGKSVSLIFLLNNQKFFFFKALKAFIYNNY